MQSKFILAIAAASLASHALADDITVDPNTFTPQRTQAEVRAELTEFKRAGANPWSTQYNPLAAFRSGRTRAEVTNEYLANRAASDAMHAEHGGMRIPGQAAPSAVAVASRQH